MKVHTVIAALVALLMPVHGTLTQCAGVDRDIKFESSGFLTADWTQKACAASGGLIDPNKKGNKKCCNVSNAGLENFYATCNGQKDPNFYPSVGPC
ncbi:hypothetical protein PHMEG_00024200 [Phytophthora megakarya]|uniref:Secreted protein n=1 Tax=Phytophthora megakarya TaxID=4795 RepID=A0A225VGI6_9STRA|nr:hypothetical protein PHMEG_00024200 [Phytophthora megakarya]